METEFVTLPNIDLHPPSIAAIEAAIRDTTCQALNFRVWYIPDPGERLADLAGALDSIARKYSPAGGLERDDYRQNAVLKLLERDQVDADFLDRPTAQLTKFADWRTRNMLESTAIYSRHVGSEFFIRDESGEDISVFELIHDDSPYPEAIAIRRERISEIYRAAHELGEHFCIMCDLLAAGYSETETARYFGISRAAITQRLKILRYRLQEV